MPQVIHNEQGNNNMERNNNNQINRPIDFVPFSGPGVAVG